jgi:exosortase H (IPTLxxWG-CTERM-specific)
MRFAGLFAAIIVALFALELTPPGQRFVVDPWTSGVVQATALLMRPFDSSVIAAGSMLLNPTTGFAVAVLAGCTGIEASIVLAAGMLAFPAPWRNRVIGLALGTLAIQALNLVRVASLFYLGQWNREAFEWAHLYLWQVLIMLDALVVWILWLRTLPQSRTPRSRPGEPATGERAKAISSP